MSVRERFFNLFAGMEKTLQFSPKGAQACRCYRKDCAGIAQQSPYIAVLLMEAEGAKTLFSDESDRVHEPQLKAGSQFRQEQA